MAIGGLAYRFLRSKNSDGFVPLITWVSISGVAVGVASLIVVTSVMNGFESELQRNITSMNGQVVLYSTSASIRNPQDLIQQIQRIEPKVSSVTWSLITGAMAAGPGGVAGVVVEGVDMESAPKVTDLASRVIKGRLPGDHEVALGSALAERLQVTEGQTLRLLIPDSENVEHTPKVVAVKVSGIVKMGMYQYDSKFVYGTIQHIQELFNKAGRVSTLKMRLAPQTDEIKVSQRLGDALGGLYTIKYWGELNKSLLYAVQLEKVVMAVILTAIMIVAAFNVVSTLMMMMHDKVREIAILKVMGLKPSQGSRLFKLIGLSIGLIGASLGVGLGLGLNLFLEKAQLVQLPYDIYYLAYLPFRARWLEVGWIAGLALLIAFLATLYPARRMARQKPLEGIRYD
jgi:lipoprotein-releasing system permease protein